MKNMIGMNIRVLRKRHKLSQEQLAEKVNVSRQTIA
ncbi:helix-turn-helix transcriptional regulator [Lysinibacillus fusiformis]|nr:helix-turn-helix domain-containing protein [Lysinibacillus fusiformis]